MMPQLTKSILGGTTLIEEDVRYVSSIFTKQMASLARSNGRRVSYLTTGIKEEVIEASKHYNFDLESCVDELRNGTFTLGPRDALKTAEIIVIDSFSVYIFGKSQTEVVELVTEMERATKEGKSFILTYEPRMVQPAIDAYIKSVFDTVISIKTDFVGSKINRLLYVQKIRSGKPFDKLVKFTIESDGVQIDTRELIG